MGPATLWSLRVWLPLGGVVAFVAGWALIGAGLRPRRSTRGGLFLAAVLYFLVGLAWVIAYNVSLGARVTDIIGVGMLPFALVWPLQVAQAFGLFGLQFR